MRYCDFIKYYIIFVREFKTTALHSFYNYACIAYPTDNRVCVLRRNAKFISMKYCLIFGYYLIIDYWNDYA